MDLLTLLIIVLIICAIGGMPTWPYARNCGWPPAGLLLLTVLILILMRFLR
jgi:Protein of unknown function (DUF3309)